MSDDKNVLLAQHVCCFVLPFVDKASERKVSTFLIIFRKQFPTHIFSPRLSPRLIPREPEERFPETIRCPSDGNILLN